MNSLVTKNTIIPKRSVVVGSPGKVIKSVDDQTFSELKAHALGYYKLAKSHKDVLF
jgi:carbonic anhydrase/acetyltransferase-like protein (isoleucine patch superfamily)